MNYFIIFYYTIEKRSKIIIISFFLEVKRFKELTRYLNRVIEKQIRNNFLIKTNITLLKENKYLL